MPEKRSFASHISADLPIKDKAEDRLNRSGFAEALANVIRGWRNKPSLVIGLFGDWGSGKSSLKNLVLESIAHDKEKSLYVVEFSPWQVSGQDLLSETFFREIGKVLGETGSSEEAVVKRRVARWKKYAGILSIAGTVARAFRSAVPADDHIGLAITGVAASVESLASVTKTGAEALDAEGAGDSLTLSELKEQISKDLRSLNKPILVVLDDIDRLTKEEIRTVLQLVKANADFPNIIYLLLAQKNSVLDALKEIAPDNPLAYLEKIIQVSFDVPAMNRKQLQDVFTQGLNELLSGPEFDRRFSKDHWGEVFPHVFSLFRNFRDLNRFLGALAFHIQLFINGDTFEVNSVDLIALEAIRLFEPAVYRTIPEAKDILTLLPRWDREKESEADKRRIEDLICLSSDPNRDAIKNLLANIFPLSNLRKGLPFQGGDLESRWFQYLRVCSYQAFDRYFQFATPEGDVSQADIDDLIARMNDIGELDRIFAKLVERDLLDVMLTRIASIEASLPLDHAATFLAALYQVKDEERQYGFFESSPKQRVQGITYWYLQRLPQDQRLQVMEEALRLTRGLSLAIAVVELLAHGPNPESTFMPFFDEQGSRDRLTKAGLEAIIHAASQDSQIPPEQTLHTLNFWARSDNTSAKEWLEAYLNSRSALINYLEAIVSKSEGTSGTRRFVFVSSFEQLISIEELEGRVDRYLNSETTADEAELVRLFRRGVKKRREGKDHFSTVWIEEDENPV